MPLTLVTLPCLADNYVYLIHDEASNACAVIDVPDAEPVLAELARRGWKLTDILLTHHHDDHIGGVPALVAATGARVTGAEADAHRLPPLDRRVREGDLVKVGAATAKVLEVPGHTVGHIAYHFAESAIAFTGDSLMAAGCGRLFEGTPAQMHSSLLKLAALPPETQICSGHEYSQTNLRFAASLEGTDLPPALAARIEKVAQLRAKGAPTLPTLLSEELATNPFLRASEPKMKAAIGMAQAGDLESFTEIRTRRNNF